MSETSQVESLLQEALTLSDVHPSKDARAFASSVAAHLSKCLSDDQPITAEWLKEQGWFNTSKSVFGHPKFEDLEWWGNLELVQIDGASGLIEFNGVRTRSDLLTLIRLIEGGDE